MKYRSRADIMAAMLNAANGGATKTKVMSTAYMSFIQCKDYLNTLEANGLIENRGGLYYTTPKGFEYLRAYEVINIPIASQVIMA